MSRSFFIETKKYSKKYASAVARTWQEDEFRKFSTKRIEFEGSSSFWSFLFRTNHLWPRCVDDHVGDHVNDVLISVRRCYRYSMDVKWLAAAQRVSNSLEDKDYRESWEGTCRWIFHVFLALLLSNFLASNRHSSFGIEEYRDIRYIGEQRLGKRWSVEAPRKFYESQFRNILRVLITSVSIERRLIEPKLIFGLKVAKLERSKDSS